jgi:hypothetical protein
MSFGQYQVVVFIYITNHIYDSPFSGARKIETNIQIT